MAFRARSALAALITASAAGLLAPVALADPPPPAPAQPAPQAVKVSCGTLDQIQESLDDDVTAGLGGLRVVISSPYFVGSQQKQDAEDKMNMVTHGVHYMQDLNDDAKISQLTTLLGQLDRANGDVHDAVESLYHLVDYGKGYGGVEMSLASPQQSTWDSIDYADGRAQAIQDLVNQLRGSCS